MKIQRYLGLVVLAVGTSAVVGSGSAAAMNVLGKIRGEINGSAKEWATIQGDILGQAMSSAHWERMSVDLPDFGSVMQQMDEHLSPEERAQLDMLRSMDMDNNLMTAMMAQAMKLQTIAQESMRITIGGHDPAQSGQLMKHSLTVSVLIDNVDTALGQAIPADLSYITEISKSGRPLVAYVSVDDEQHAFATFDALNIAPDGGHTSGHFQGTLCRLDMSKLMQGPDLSDCIESRGTFDTALVEQTSDQR